MESRMILFSLIPLLFLGMIGCSAHHDSNYDNAKRFINQKGYKIVSNGNKIPDYILNRDLLLKFPYELYWGVSDIDPKEYIDKNIKTYAFIVRNHPLDDLKNNTKKEAIVYVMSCNNKIIGGYSSTNSNESGGVYSIDGKTLEQVSGLSGME